MNDNPDYKQFLCEISFTRDWPEHGTYPIHAKDAEHARAKVAELFGDMRDVKVHDVYPFVEPKKDKPSLVGFEEKDPSEDDKDPTIN